MNDCRLNREVKWFSVVIDRDLVLKDVQGVVERARKATWRRENLQVERQQGEITQRSRECTLQ